MCGICGKYYYSKNGIIDKNLIRKMADVLGHRGPDDEGFLIEDCIGLGHKRLSILDLSSAGHQPMCNEDKNIWVIFNGEIYNYKELRSALKDLGHIFTSECDTEVIVHSYEEYGAECITHFNGMFAFAIWDARKERLLLARDRVGVKPLYYYIGNGFISWASEIKSILEDSSIPREVDRQGLSNLLTLHYVPAPRTMFTGVKKLLPGHYMLCNRNGVTIKRYWELNINPDKDRRNYDKAYYINQVYDRLKESVKKRLQSDVPVGVLLSGGLDSSSILGLITEIQGAPLKSFSVGYSRDPKDKFTEFYYAKKAANYFGSEYYEVVVDWKKFLDFLPKAVWYEDEPISEDSAVPMHYVCKLAKDNGVTVLLTGEGSDEIFAGYNRHWGEILTIFYQMIPSQIRNSILNKLIYNLPRASLLKKGHRSMTIASFFERFLSWHTVFTDDLKKDLMKSYADKMLAGIKNDVFDPYLAKIRDLNDLDKILYLDFHVWLPDDLLMKKDKMGMSVATEARVPFLDYEFVEFAFSIPTDLKVKGITTKYILKKSMERLLPKEIIYRKKEGFPTPISPWLRYELKDFTMDSLLSKNSGCHEFFNMDVVERLIREHVSGREDHERLIFPLINFELWYQTFIANNLRYS